jgi:myo-inositol 2-dehydrogenase/D-chiro-inositol 1-dehydrogenase
MEKRKLTRRSFLHTSAAGALAVTPYFITRPTTAAEARNDRPLFGAIGVGPQGLYVGQRAVQTGGDCVAVCDLDQQRAESAQQQLGGKGTIYEDYRRLLDHKEIEFVTIGTPEHWHTPIALAALEAGKHVYCEKPVSLTVDEGKLLVAAVKRTGKTFQVGTQQRGDQIDLFGRAVATVRSGQLGKLKTIQIFLPPTTLEGGPFNKEEIPQGFNWEMWQGQAPAHDYCHERCHFTFRWWYEYSGGIMTDWGTHLMDIVLWALNLESDGPLTVDGSKTKLPNVPNGYNTPRYPVVDYLFPGQVQVRISADDSKGILFEGEKGRIFVNRARITGKPIEEQDANPDLKAKVMEAAKDLFKGNVAQLGNHMGNFFEAFKHGLPPISDIEGQHRATSACHIGNISIRLGRPLKWDAAKQEFIDDSEASAWLKREQRAPYQFSSNV